MLQLQYFHHKYDPRQDSQMHKSLVVKARVEDVEATEAAIFDLTDSLGTFFQQEDVYFNVPHGHLKLRIMHPNRCGQLIFNSCSKLSGHKMSESQITEVEDVFNIRATLGAALGELGTIKKKRRIFTTNDIRIYLDDVAEIGQFIDVAVMMPNAADKDECCKRASDVRRKLKISDSSVVPSAYLDMIIRRCSFDEESNVQTDQDDTTGDSDSSLSSSPTGCLSPMIPVTRVHGPGPAEQMSIRLESDRVCGSGRFSNVYRATVTTASSTVLAVAVKNVWEEKNSPPIVGTHPEVRILAQLDHPNVVRLLYHYTKEIEQQRVFCLVLNFMPDDMAKLRERGVRFDPLDACLYAYQLLSAVAHLADRQVLHLDIKPANLLVDHSAGILQLADFGNAQKAEGKELEQTNVYQVTRYYRPPEVLFGSKFFSTAIDTWSAACCIAEFVTGHVLFKGRSAADQTKLLIGVFGYPTDEDVKAMRVTRPRTSRPAPRGLDKYTGGDIPPELMDLLRLVFVYNPAKRAAARDCLAMGFFARLKTPHHPTRGNGTPLPELLLVGLEGGGGTKKTTDEQKRQGEEAEEDSDSEEAD